MKVKYLIVGAGPTALGAAYRLKEQGEDDFVVIEQHPWVGGLSTSFLDDQGFTWDVGGHIQFSHYDYFDKVMNEALGEDGWFFHE
ncbi:NAD(P)-binding protein, partial [Oligoflexia bacterium]|nr:NAD(P)-binding protein [Oligoflexia bacterium]